MDDIKDKLFILEIDEGFVIRLIKLFVLAFFPSYAIKKLRYLRVYGERLKCYLYSKGLEYKGFYPYFLKYNQSKILKEVKVVGVDPSVRWGQAFCYYNSFSGKPTIKLSWADGPIPGNFGDWLSPYIISKICKINIIHVNEIDVSKMTQPHIVAIGSIINSINEFSHVVGSGITSRNDTFNKLATFHSVRGKETARRLSNLGGKDVNTYGDLGYLLREVYLPKGKCDKKDKILVVRHINHQSIDIVLNSSYREVSIGCSYPDDIEEFVDELHNAKYVATSAMHCLIACISYGIPCVFFTFNDGVNKVPGDGVKYLDVVNGVGLPEVPIVVISKLDQFCTKIENSNQYTSRIESGELDKMKCFLSEAVTESIIK